MRVKSKAFTVIEIIVVVVILSFIIAFTIPVYNRAISKAKEREMTVLLRAVHSVCEIFRAKNGSYWDPGATVADVNTINTTLGLNLKDTVEYDWKYTPDNGVNYTATIEYYEDGGPLSFEFRVDQNNISDDNPCCKTGCGEVKTLPTCP